MWYELGDLISYAKVKRARDLDLPVLSMTSKNGIMLQNNRFKKDIASKDRSNYKVVRRGQFVFGFPMDEGVMYSQKIVDEGILSPAYDVCDVKKSIIDPNYLEAYLHGPRALTFIKEKLRGTTARRRVVPKDQLGTFTLDIPSLGDQSKRLNRLSLMQLLLENEKQLLVLLDELVQSRFNELFINKNQNDKESLLKDVASLMSGITKGRRIKGPTITVPYMAVSNVKDGYLDLSTIKTIEASEQEVEKYRLLPNDVLMTEGGDPDKLGRGCVIETPLHNCIHQNHIFRVRLNNRLLTPTYFQFYLQDKKAREYFLRSAKQTTGIASLNMTQLRNLPVIIPPIGQQLVFEEDVQVINKSKFIRPINA